MPKKIQVSQTTCIGCGSCTAICPKTFSIDDQGKSQVINQNGETEDEQQVAIDSCPVKAISRTEEDVTQE